MFLKYHTLWDINLHWKELCCLLSQINVLTSYSFENTKRLLNKTSSFEVFVTDMFVTEKNILYGFYGKVHFSNLFGYDVIKIV